MAVPDFESLMAPLLQAVSDGQEHILREVRSEVATKVGLTEADLRELLRGGRQTKFANRLSWAKIYMTKAGLLESTGRAVFRITQRGSDFLAVHQDGIKFKLLKEFPEFQAFMAHTESRSRANPPGAEKEGVASPEEVLEEGYATLRQQVAQELLSRVKAMSPGFFERLVVDLLVAMGYGGSREDAGSTVGQSGDGGIDGIIKEDKLGLDNVFIQAKRWEGAVGRPVVQGFAGSLEGQRARKGVLITTSTFTQDAKQYVERIEKKIVLIDGEQLANLMLDHGVGVSEVGRYLIHKVDLDYFSEAG